MATTRVILAQAGDSRVDGFAAVRVLDGHFAEEKVDKVVRLERADELGRVEPLGVVLHRAQSSQTRRVTRKATG